MKKPRDTQQKAITRGVGRPQKPSKPLRIDAVLYDAIKANGNENVRDFLEQLAKKELLEIQK